MRRRGNGWCPPGNSVTLKNPPSGPGELRNWRSCETLIRASRSRRPQAVFMGGGATKCHDHSFGAVASFGVWLFVEGWAPPTILIACALGRQWGWRAVLTLPDSRFRETIQSKPPRRTSPSEAGSVLDGELRGRTPIPCISRLGEPICGILDKVSDMRRSHLGR